MNIWTACILARSTDTIASMILATKLRNGVNFEYNGKPYRVLDYKHKHVSRGGGTVKVKVRELITGTQSSMTFKSTEKFDEIDVFKKTYQFLFQSDGFFVFMDPVSFEQVEVKQKIVGEDGQYLKEGEEYEVMIWDERILGLRLPPKMTFKVAEADPAEKGDSASNVYKDAKLENGMSVRVPLFVNKGDVIRIDTRSGEYVERAWSKELDAWFGLVDFFRNKLFYCYVKGECRVWIDFIGRCFCPDFRMT